MSARTLGPDLFSAVHLPLRTLEKPRGDAVHLWHLDLGHLSNPLNPAGPTDHADLSVFQQRTTRRFYLRLILGAYLGLPGKDVHITRRIKGRPELDPDLSGGELNFSVARSDGCYLIGVNSGATIGVDMEMTARRPGKPMALARRYFSQQEIAALSGFDKTDLHRAFMHTWACKEAIVKASGMGIANQLCRFSVDVNPDNPPAVLEMPDDDHRAWKLAMAEPVPGAIAVVAVRQQSVRLEGFRLIA
ncbi:MAG TPA: 4'-phosphopantetheinyl transferase superfamily protein [Xanthomonadales bacterium]